MKLKASALAFAACFAITTFLATTRLASATDTVHGVVLSVLRDQDEAVVRHEPFGGMPAMTMVFQISPKGMLARLRSGDRIQAQVDVSADPWRMEDIQVTGRATAAGPSTILHNVQPLQVGDVLPTTTFFDQNGRGFSFEDFRGQTLLLAFIYTRCRDPRMCPLISANFHMLQQKIAGLPIHLIEITLDPAYDTPEVLANYGRLFGQDPNVWTLGTGPVNVVNDFAARFGIAVFNDPTAGLIHSEATAIVDRNGQIVDIMNEAAWNPDSVAAELRSVAALPTNPIALLDYELSKASAALCGNNLPGTSGLLALFLVVCILSGATWILYRWAKIIFVDEPPDTA
jgi:protein SCO1/2